MGQADQRLAWRHAGGAAQVVSALWSASEVSDYPMSKPASFSTRKAPSSKDGYGNRRVTRCNKCRAVVYDGDPGNGPGFRYDETYRNRAMNSHVCASKKQIDEVQRDIKLDWTRGQNGRSNSSALYHVLAGEVARIIRDMHVGDDPDGTGRLIISQLAHVHGLRPNR